jgi:L-ribulose-5-phosphate 4-epimerase
MLEKLKNEVCKANLLLVKEGLVVRTWGNASGVDRARGLMVIKPSGVPYERLRPQQMVIVELGTGRVVSGTLRPSSDAPTHRLLYEAYRGIGGIAHTHSMHATAWAQARRAIPPLGTTHADYFPGPVPCTRALRPEEIAGEYEANTGRVIIECLGAADPPEAAGVLVASHAPFTWGKDVHDAVEHAVILEHIARLAAETLALAPSSPPIDAALLTRHFTRKHGPGATYGQQKREKR